MGSMPRRLWQDMTTQEFGGADAARWIALLPVGACGDATNADAARGRQLVEHAARALVTLLEEVDRYPLANLRAGPAES